MILKIVQAGDENLRKRSRKLTVAEIKTTTMQQLIDLMIATLRDKPGVGLAAPQVGEAMRIIVLEDKKQYQMKLSKELLAYQKRKPVELAVFINPKVTVQDTNEEFFFEGCLSVEGYRAIVPRARKIIVSGLDREGNPISMNVEGWFARIIQHEVDHLDGDLYIDKMYSKSLITEKHFSDNWAQASPLKFDKYVKKIRNLH